MTSFINEKKSKTQESIACIGWMKLVNEIGMQHAFSFLIKDLNTYLNVFYPQLSSFGKSVSNVNSNLTRS